MTLDEFKGRVPIRRGQSVVPTEGGAFDNPLLTRHYEARTGGSRSPGSPLRHRSGALAARVPLRSAVSRHVRFGVTAERVVAPGAARFGGVEVGPSPGTPRSSVRAVVFADAGVVRLRLEARRLHPRRGARQSRERPSRAMAGARWSSRRGEGGALAGRVSRARHSGLGQHHRLMRRATLPRRARPWPRHRRNLLSKLRRAALVRQGPGDRRGRVHRALSLCDVGSRAHGNGVRPSLHAR